ncbi:MAG: DUF447 family protein [Planctomycetaceae bacterium]
MLMPLILEGLTSTRDADGSIHAAAMGPMVDEAMSELVFRPFPTSRTYANLLRDRQGVFHITDDVLLLTQLALGESEPLDWQPTVVVDGAVASGACRWYEFRVEDVDLTGERPLFVARVVYRGRLRDFIGLNRARHAVIEAAILATRVHLTGIEPARLAVEQLRVAVEKTGGPREQAALSLVVQYLANADAEADA